MFDTQLDLFTARVATTRPLRAHPRAPGLLRRLGTCLQLFPELRDHEVTVGITRVADGIAVLDDMTVRFDLRRRLPTRYTIGHELTHLLQAIRLVPGGEVQCDIWTLARHPLLRDEPPCYLPLPPGLHERWPAIADAVGEACAEAIAVREHHRTYIRWLGRRLGEIAV